MCSVREMSDKFHKKNEVQWVFFVDNHSLFNIAAASHRKSNKRSATDSYKTDSPVVAGLQPDNAMYLKNIGMQKGTFLCFQSIHRLRISQLVHSMFLQGLLLLYV